MRKFGSLRLNIDELYQHDEQSEIIWQKFRHFGPTLSYLRFSPVKRALALDQKDYFVNKIRNAFFPALADDIIQEQFRLAMNRGINSLNSRCKEIIPEIADIFAVKEVVAPLD